MKKIINFLFVLTLSILSATSIIVARTITSVPIIYIDAGHGGADGGTAGSDGTFEKNIDLSIALKLKELFEASGYRVFMTRDGDYDLASEGSKNRKREDIHKRVDLINSSNCIVYLSIHGNGYPSSKIRGAQTFFNPKVNGSEELAKSIQETIKSTLLNTKRVAKSISGKYLIDHVNKTGCLVEVGFLSNPEELRLLNDESYQHKIAYCIYSGTLNYLTNIS